MSSHKTAVNEKGMQHSIAVRLLTELKRQQNKLANAERIGIELYGLEIDLIDIVCDALGVKQENAHLWGGSITNPKDIFTRDFIDEIFEDLEEHDISRFVYWLGNTNEPFVHSKTAQRIGE